MSKKTKGLLIDLLLLFVYCIIIIMLFIYFGFDCVYKTRIIPTLLLLFSMLICWGTIIFSVRGKNTIGHRIMNKENK